MDPDPGAFAVAAWLAFYAARMVPHVARAFREALADRWSVAVACLMVAALAVLFAVKPPLPPLFTALLAAVAVAPALAPPLHLRWRVKHPAKPGPTLLAHHEDRRKGFHLVLGLVIPGYLVLGTWVLGGVEPLASASLGCCPALQADLAASAQAPMAGHVFSTWVLSAVMLLILPFELSRLARPEGPYILQAFTERRLRDRERRLFGHHLYIVIATVLAITWLADPGMIPSVPAVLAVVAVSVFADAASAIAGTRWGRRRLPHNHGKSYVGSLAGLVVAALVAYPFVGLVGALLGSAVFLIVDLLAPKPLPLSDNLLNPTSLAVVFMATEAHLAPVGPWPAWFGL